MDNMNWLVATMVCEQLVRERLEAAGRQQPPKDDKPGGGAKRAIASALVRLGLRLDPAAGDGLGAAGMRQAGAGR